MPKQPAFPGLRDAMKKKVTRREQFLAERDAVVPWGRLAALTPPHHPKAGPKGGRPSIPLETMRSRSATCSWCAGGGCHEDESARNLPSRPKGGPKVTKSAA